MPLFLIINENHRGQHSMEVGIALVEIRILCVLFTFYIWCIVCLYLCYYLLGVLTFFVRLKV